MKTLKTMMVLCMLGFASNAMGQSVCNFTTECQFHVQLKIKSTGAPCGDTAGVMEIGVGVMGCEPLSIPPGFEIVQATIMNGADMIPLATLQPAPAPCDFGLPNSTILVEPCGGNIIDISFEGESILISL
ncbi:hypothetical protein EAX61_15035 [Dokdonia sinensis]|uniref:DUF4280 domain-containing protein n=1 Tax=Dokdonia sinensis TaxID=2479847 RepID=A0A3M0FUE1_9FLAO|nr:hypothetical protein [Dokdonia sinensis]RMB56271.1 hypothetical protein EAX61_15035 [Dokdonia sinensis]